MRRYFYIFSYFLNFQCHRWTNRPISLLSYIFPLLFLYPFLIPHYPNPLYWRNFKISVPSSRTVSICTSFHRQPYSVAGMIHAICRRVLFVFSSFEGAQTLFCMAGGATILSAVCLCSFEIRLAASSPLLCFLCYLAISSESFLSSSAWKQSALSASTFSCQSCFCRIVSRFLLD